MISNVEVLIEQYPQVRMDWGVQYRETSPVEAGDEEYSCRSDSGEDGGDYAR